MSYMNDIQEKALLRILQLYSNNLESEKDIEPLIKKLGLAKIVMLGEASHGNHEYYIWRAQLSKRLIEDYGFNFIAVEGDWPDCYEVNRYVKGYSYESAYDVLHRFNRWPSWMWANWEMAAFTDWLKKHNEP